MRSIRYLAFIALGFAALLPTLSANAGGWATVELVGYAPAIVAGEPVALELVVKGHGVEPVDVDGLTLVATNRSTGEIIEIKGNKVPGTGRYQVNVTFPTDGEWSFAATPAPYGPFEMGVFTVLTPAAAQETLAGALNVEVVTGPCGPGVGSGETLDLTDMDGALFGMLPDALTSESAILLRNGAGSVLACGQLDNPLNAGRSVVALSPSEGSETSGIAVLDQIEGETTVAIYPVTVSAAAKFVTIEIVGNSGSWRFEPATVEIDPGTTVIWENSTTEGHTVTGPEFSFETSGAIAPGARFAQTFDEPGTFEYICGPHTTMTGTIVVK